jgi:hypothetical protein
VAAERSDAGRFIVRADEITHCISGTRSGDSKQVTNRQLLGIFGSAILFIGVFMPIVNRLATPRLSLRL